MKARTMGVLGACMIAVLPRSAAALEVNGGVSAGGIMAGVVPRLAISPHVGLSWRTESGFLFELHTVASILPLGRVGFFNETSAALGYVCARRLDDGVARRQHDGHLRGAAGVRAVMPTRSRAAASQA